MEDADQGFLAGKFLIAMPGMEDPRFAGSVIFMCAHDAHGAMGLIVNKPVEGLHFEELLSRYRLPGEDTVPDIPVLFGGPVEVERGFILHSNDYVGSEGTMPVTDRISLTANVDILRAIAQGHGPSECLLALGYAGWGEGQIEDEIRANGWIHCDADADLVFGADYDMMWQQAIGTLGVAIAGLSGSIGSA